MDLHAHTTASDGSLSPAELVHLAVSCGLGALGVTDHDTLAGLPEALESASGCGIELVPGVELSVEYPGHFHLLGYLFDPAYAPLDDRLRYLRDHRASRNVRMLEKIQECGLPITLEDVRAEAGGEVLGRPHMAKALVRKGIVDSVKEAFNRYLADGRPCHVPKAKLTPEEGIALIRAAGGVPVMAHPFTLKMDPEKLEAELCRLKECGLGGIECYYSQHSPDQQNLFLGIARRLDLVATGGSDFHGDTKPHVHLGVVTGGGPASLELLDRLKAERR